MVSFRSSNTPVIYAIWSSPKRLPSRCEPLPNSSVQHPGINLHSEESGPTRHRNVLCVSSESSLEDEMDKTTLLNTIQMDYAQFESLIAPLSEAQLCTAPFEGEWSIKDSMAHIAVWEQLCTRWLAEFLRGMTPQPAERLDQGSNDRIYRENRDRSLAEV